MMEVTDRMVELAARAMCSKDYALRFALQETDLHVRQNVDSNWQWHAPQARVALEAAMTVAPLSEAVATKHLPDWVAGFLNRRTTVEQVLRLPMQNRRKGLPIPEPLTPEVMEELANTLAIPIDFAVQVERR